MRIQSQFVMGRTFFARLIEQVHDTIETTVQILQTEAMTVLNQIPREKLEHSFLRSDNQAVRWEISEDLADYDASVSRMEELAARIHTGEEMERVWLLEHPPLYSAGTRAKDSDLLDQRFPVYKTGRGGEHTYHGPGQRICYVMLDLSKRKQDVRQFVSALEQWTINSLAALNITAERREDRVGVWVKRPEKAPLEDGTPREDKVAAIGIRLRKWVSFHGISINVEPDLSHYDGIIPCGVRGHGVTSLVDLGIPVTMSEFDSVLRAEFEKTFGPTI